MNAAKADWRHLTGAGVLLLVFVCLIAWFTLGRDTTRPTAPAPAGPNPVYDTPPETPPVAR